MFGIQHCKHGFCRVILGAWLVIFPFAATLAGGGAVLSEDACIIEIDFYSTHFTAYQPNSSGNKQFCRNFPDIGETILVLDYLHQSLKEVPVGVRIIRDVTGLGRFVKLKHIEAIEDWQQATVFHQPPAIHTDASLSVEHEFREQGNYILIVTAGHPTSDAIYTAVFPFEVGGSGSVFWVLLALILAGLALFTARRLKKSRRTAGQQMPANLVTLKEGAAR